MRKFLSLVLASFALQSGAFALCNGCDMYRIKPMSGLNLEVFGGWALPQLPTKNYFDASFKRNDTWLWGGTAGLDIHIPCSYWLIGVEGSYLSFGDTKYLNADLTPNNTFEIKSWGWQAMGKLTYVFVSGWDIFAKAGATYVTTEFSPTLPFFDVDNGTIRNWLPTIAVGFGILPCQNFTISIQYEHLFGHNWQNFDPTFKRSCSIDLISLNLAYKFCLR